MALDESHFLDLLFKPRLAAPLVVAIAIGVGYYFVNRETPDSAAVAFGIGFVGLIIGVIWHIAGGSKPGSA